MSAKKPRPTQSYIKNAARRAENPVHFVKPLQNKADVKLDKVSRAQSKKISSLVTDNSSSLLKVLPQLWNEQDLYRNNALFSEFITKYYSRNFGDLSPHLKTFFDRVSMLQDRELELQVTKRVSYLAQNKLLLALAALPDRPDLPERAFRLRYLSDISQLTAGNFRPEQLVLSMEWSMSPNLQKDLPLRHVNAAATVNIGKQTYPVYNYNGPLDYIALLYRYLINGNHKNRPLTVIFDETSRAMAIYNENRTFWLRLSSHEYSSPERLHMHLNEQRTVNFINIYGVERTETINCNLFIPLATPEDLPKHGVQEFLYQKLILNPIKSWKGNDHVTVENRPIF